MIMIDIQIIIALLVALVAVQLIRSRVRKVTIFEFERGLLYTNGAFQTVVEPGARWIWTPTQMLTKLDVRPRITSVPGQEVLSSDGIAVKLSVVAQYRIVDPMVAVIRQASFESALYTELQLAIRQIVASESIASLLESRAQMRDRLVELTAKKVQLLGLELLQADVKDLTLPGELKKLFTQVTKARQEGLAALERARGETAALRNLANAARLIADNPALLQLRMLQVIGEQPNNTVVLGFPAAATPLPVVRGGS
jgi:regulator of protease activity HflC (stomatin/prohibitin superfamily)